MCFKRSYLVGFAVYAGMVLSGCKPEPMPTITIEPDEIVPIGTETSVQYLFPTQTSEPTLTNTPEPTPSPSPSPTHIPTPTQAVLSRIVRRLCPELRAPLGLFSVPEMFYDNATDPATLYVPYQVIELSPDSTGGTCTFLLSPPPMSAPQLAGDSLFWQSFDHEAEWVMVWKYDPLDALTDEAFPQHLPLRQTRTNTSIGKSGLFDFVVADNGETLVWSFTDPKSEEGYGLSYVQEMYAASTSGPIDQRPPAEVWFDFVFEPDSEAHIIRPRKFSSDGERVYYSLEPVGLGRQWPEPRGRYTSLYSISTLGDASPELHFDCGYEYWCISDFSEDQDILVSVWGESIRIIEMSTGDLISEVPADEAYPFVRQAFISPDGTIAFLGVSMAESFSSDLPEDVAIFMISPPYLDVPNLVLSDAGLMNLLGWISPGSLLVDGRNLEGRTPEMGIVPKDLILVSIDSGTGEWLPLDAGQFVSLVR